MGVKQTYWKWPQSHRMENSIKPSSNQIDSMTGKMKRPKWCERVGAENTEDRRWQRGGRGENWIERVRKDIRVKKRWKKENAGCEKTEKRGRETIWMRGCYMLHCWVRPQNSQVKEIKGASLCNPNLTVIYIVLHQLTFGQTNFHYAEIK